MMKYILAIETSCDETAAAIISEEQKVVASEISSQIHKHQEYGGVVPEVASRMHVENIYRVIDLVTSQVSYDDIVAIAVTAGPGLLGSLMIGLTQAKMMALLYEKPLISINHMEGHIWANFLVHPKSYPFLTLVVSGGHTMIVRVDDYASYQILAETVDDAAGEAFDKVARVLNLGYPGGPIIDRIAKEGNDQAVDFPRAILKDGSDNFSFSGIKTAVINYVRKHPEADIADVAASFQRAVVSSLVEKTVKLVEKTGIDNVFLSGGVAANSCLRDSFQEIAQGKGFTINYPPLVLCTDNAAMIGAAAWEKYHNSDFASLELKADPSLRL